MKLFRTPQDAATKALFDRLADRILKHDPVDTAASLAVLLSVIELSFNKGELPPETAMGLRVAVDDVLRTMNIRHEIAQYLAALKKSEHLLQ